MTSQIALPSPPLIEHALFESPWAYALAFVIAGLVARAVLRRQERASQGMVAGLAGLVLGGGLVLVASLVTTERETLIERTKELVAEVGALDGSGTRPYLAGEVGVAVLSSEAVWSRDDVVRRVETLGSITSITGARASGVRASVDSKEVARTTLRVWADLDGEFYKGRQGSDWLLVWRKLDGGVWEVTRIECLKIDGMPQNTPVRLPPG